jgi:hypothetical protein
MDAHCVPGKEQEDAQWQLEANRSGNDLSHGLLFVAKKTPDAGQFIPSVVGRKQFQAPLEPAMRRMAGEKEHAHEDADRGARPHNSQRELAGFSGRRE